MIPSSGGNYRMSQYNTIESYYQNDIWNEFYPETYDACVKGRTYFSGNQSEMVGTIAGVYKIPINRNIIAKGGLTWSSDGTVTIQQAGIYAVSARMYVSDQAYNNYNLAVRKNNNVALAESMAVSLQMSRNMDGYNPGGGFTYGHPSSFLNVYSITPLEAGDNVYMTLQSESQTFSRMNQNGGMELFLLQANL